MMDIDSLSQNDNSSDSELSEQINDVGNYFFN